MEVIRTRNAQQAMAPMLNLLFTEGTRQAGDPALTLDVPVAFIFERPQERLVFWPGLRRNPAEEIRQAALSLMNIEAMVEPAAKQIAEGPLRQFQFQTPMLAMTSKVTKSGHLESFSVISETNPLLGAVGTLGLHLTMVQEFLAVQLKKPVGQHTILHLGLTHQEDIIKTLLGNALADGVRHWYEDGTVKPRKLELPAELAQFAEMGLDGIGYKSKWIRHVAIPLLQVDRFLPEHPEQARKELKNIKASDWRIAMECYIEQCEDDIEAAAGEES